MNVDKVVEAVVDLLPSPDGDPEAPLKALIFDSWYDSYQGVVVLFRILDGTLKKGMNIKIFSTGKDFEVTRLGAFMPEAVDIKEHGAGRGRVPVCVHEGTR